MNRTDFIRLLEEPERSRPAMAREIEELLGIFPYFQGGYMLLLKVLKDHEDMGFGDKLRKVAPYVADREVLYHFLNGKAGEERIESFVVEGEVESGYVSDQDIGEIVSPETEPVTADDNGLLELDSAPSPNELIDKFIEEDPRIRPIRLISEEPQEDIAGKFSEERDGLVSETLAEIYIKQKYYYRAIEIYEKLSLNYPEKSSYFVARIKNVKDLINP